MISVQGLLIGVFQAFLLLLAAPLFSGFSRMMRAKFHSRKGPPLLQNYYDLAKLMKRQEVTSRQVGLAFRLAPAMTLCAMLLAALLLPALGAFSPLGVAGDLILVVYLFAIPRVFTALAGLESGSNFAGAGARRELLVSALVEPVLLLVVFVMALRAGSTNLGAISLAMLSGSTPYSMAVWLGLAAFAFGVYVEMGKLPYDLGEAEQELQEGPLAEYSGRSLALMKWGIYLKQLTLVGLLIALFAPFGAMTVFSLPGLVWAVVIFLLKALVVIFGIGILENSMARTRIANAPAAAWLALGAAVLSFVFYLARV
jgi:hydrogenase-4 component C